MSVVFIKELERGVFLGVWKFDENADSVNVNLPYRLPSASRSICESRQREVISVYSLVGMMTGKTDFIIGHHPSGRPYLEGYHIGISHTKQYASVILSKTKKVSVDIEYQSDRIVRIANRFLRDDEKKMFVDGNAAEGQSRSIFSGSPDYTPLLLSWCAKETMFKYYSDARLTFEYMRVSGLSRVASSGIFYCENLLTAERRIVSYEVNSRFCLTYMIG